MILEEKELEDASEEPALKGGAKKKDLKEYLALVLLQASQMIRLSVDRELRRDRQ